MRKIFTVLFVISLILVAPAGGTFVAHANGPQDQNSNSNKRKLSVPNRGRRGGRDTRKHRGIGHAYKEAGKSAGRGGKRLGRNVRHGKPVKGGKEFGKGMGGFGKGVGQGTGRAGKKVGTKVKEAVKP